MEKGKVAEALLRKHTQVRQVKTTVFEYPKEVPAQLAGDRFPSVDRDRFLITLYAYKVWRKLYAYKFCYSSGVEMIKEQIKRKTRSPVKKIKDNKEWINHQYNWAIIMRPDLVLPLDPGFFPRSRPTMKPVLDARHFQSQLQYWGVFFFGSVFSIQYLPDLLIEDPIWPLSIFGTDHVHPEKKIPEKT